MSFVSFVVPALPECARRCGANRGAKRQHPNAELFTGTRSSWLKQFGLFKAIGGQDRNSDAAEIILCHFMFSFMNLGRSKISVETS